MDLKVSGTSRYVDDGVKKTRTHAHAEAILDIVLHVVKVLGFQVWAILSFEILDSRPMNNGSRGSFFSSQVTTQVKTKSGCCLENRKAWVFKKYN